jgi:hypothetical protein
LLGAIACEAELHKTGIAILLNEVNAIIIIEGCLTDQDVPVCKINENKGDYLVIAPLRF